jgi:hypothetical protein
LSEIIVVAATKGDAHMRTFTLPRLIAAGMLALVVTAGVTGPALARPRDGKCWTNQQIRQMQANADPSDSIHMIDTSNPVGMYCNPTIAGRPLVTTGP